MISMQQMFFNFLLIIINVCIIFFIKLYLQTIFRIRIHSQYKFNILCLFDSIIFKFSCFICTDLLRHHITNKQRNYLRLLLISIDNNIQIMSAKGPNALNKNAYVHGQEEEGQYVEDVPLSKPNIDLHSIEDQFDNFVKDLQKYDKILSDVAKNIQEIGGQGELLTDFYPPFIAECHYTQDQEKKIIANTDPELQKIVFNLQRNNKVLKEEMQGWVFQFAKTAKLTEVLISQNQLLRQSIKNKNKEIVKLIQGIGKAQSTEINQLAQNLQLLKEENGVLKEHLHKLKQELEQKKNEQNRVDEALENTKKQYQRIEQAKIEAEDTQQHLSKTYELLQLSKTQNQKRKRKLEKERQILLKKKSDYEIDHNKILKELTDCQREKEDIDNNLKKTYSQQESEKYRLIEQIDQLGDTISKLKQEGRYFEQESKNNIDRLVQYEKIAKEYQQKIIQNEEKIKLLKNQMESSQKKQVEVMSQIQIQQFDLSVLQQQYQELEEKQRKILEQTKKEIKILEQQNSRQLADWQNKMSQNQRELAMRILQQKAELSTKQRELERWEQKIYEKKQELTDLKGQMKEIKQNQIRMAQLRSQLKSQQ